MNGAPLVSVCMPCHNAARYVRAALDSVLAQTYRNIEIVAVDDGSTDETGVILDEYTARAGVRVIRAALANAAKARNLAYRHSRGEFIKFFDADDLLSPDMVASQVARLCEEPRAVASAGWVRFGRDPRAAEPRPDGTWRDAAPLDWLLESLRGGGRRAMMQCGMFLIPRQVIERAGGWDERLTLIDDLEFYVRTLLTADRVLHTDTILYYRSGLNGSLSARKSRTAYESAVTSVGAAADSLMRAADSSTVRAVCADLLQAWYFEIAPQYPDLGRRLQAQVDRLGGSPVRPSGGPVFQRLADIVGWRAAAKLRAMSIDRGYGRLRSCLRGTKEPARPQR